jgi:hypothetical protein
MAEWSKAVDSRPTLFGGAGSNPARCKLIWFRSVTVITRAFDISLGSKKARNPSSNLGGAFFGPIV